MLLITLRAIRYDFWKTFDVSSFDLLQYLFLLKVLSLAAVSFFDVFDVIRVVLFFDVKLGLNLVVILCFIHYN